jgi:excisionase family DNA binding protein
MRRSKGRAAVVVDGARPEIHVDVADDVLTRKQACELIQISDRTLDRLVQKRKGPRRKFVGRQVRYLRSEVLRWLQEGAQ